jgi:hypothetical protein
MDIVAIVLAAVTLAFSRVLVKCKIKYKAILAAYAE